MPVIFFAHRFFNGEQRFKGVMFSMQIKVRLHDILQDKVAGYAGSAEGAFDYQLPVGVPVSHLLKVLELDSRYVGLMVVNGRQAGKDYSLQDGDRLELFSPMSGG